MMEADGHDNVNISHIDFDDLTLYFDNPQEVVFCDNETNTLRVYGMSSPLKYFKDGINNYVVNGQWNAVNPALKGTKVAGCYRLYVEPESSVTVNVRLAAPGHQRRFF